MSLGEGKKTFNICFFTSFGGWAISQADVLVEGGDVTLIGWGTQVN